jgi:uncharacterized LabA/DUF88 family protein
LGWLPTSNHPAILADSISKAAPRPYSCPYARVNALRPSGIVGVVESTILISRNGKISLFIDGANLHATARALGFAVDFKRLLLEFQSRGTLIRAFFYTAIFEGETISTIRPLLDWLDYNGYTVVTKAAKEFVDGAGQRKIKSNMDIELTVDALEMSGFVDQIVLFSGDGALRSLVEALQSRGVRVTVVSSIATDPPMVAGELRRQADTFVDLKDLMSRIGRQ